jgi:hypothetical protein
MGTTMCTVALHRGTLHHFDLLSFLVNVGKLEAGL